MDLDKVIRSAGGKPELAVQIYTASLIAIEVDSPAEKQYMQQLENGLGLTPQITGNIRKYFDMV